MPSGDEAGKRAEDHRNTWLFGKAANSPKIMICYELYIQGVQALHRRGMNSKDATSSDSKRVHDLTEDKSLDMFEYT